MKAKISRKNYVSIINSGLPSRPLIDVCEDLAIIGKVVWLVHLCTASRNTYRASYGTHYGIRYNAGTIMFSCITYT